MKCVLEFGVRGGAHTDSIIVNTAALAASIAKGLIRVFENNQDYQVSMLVERKTPRISWQSSSHFVSVTVLDGVMRGPAAAKLWKKDN